MTLAAAILSLSALSGFAQCVTPGTPINFSTAGNNTTAGYTTTYVLTDNSGNIQQTVGSGFAAPNQTGSFKVYAVNYNTAAGNTAPTLTAGTNVTAIGGTCASVSSAPITFCVTASCVAPGSSVSFAAAGNNTASGYTTVYALTDNSGNIISTSSSSPVTAPTASGSYRIYVVNYNTASGNTAPTLTAGTNIGAIGGTCTAASGAPLLFDVCAPACNAGTAQVSLSGNSLTIACGSTSANLTTLVSSTAPAGTSIVFYTTADHSGTQYATPTNATAGTYYAFIFDAANNCFNTNASTAQIVVSNPTNCPPTVPDLTPVLLARPTPVYGTTNITVVADIYELNNVPTSGTIIIKIPKDPRFTLSMNSGATTVNGQLVQNSAWTFTGPSGGFYTLTTTNVINGSVGTGKLSFGLDGVFTPGSSSGIAPVSIIIDSGGGETRVDNNNDAERFDYFQQ